MKKSIVYGVIASACWGFSNVISKSLLSHFLPLSLLAIQLMASNFFLWAFLAFCKKTNLCRVESIKYSLPGLLQPGLAFSFSVFGLNLTTANSEALIWASETIVIIFLAAFLLRERIGWFILFLAAVGTCGTIMATTPNSSQSLDATILMGNLLILLGVVCAAFYSIYTQRQLISIDPLRLTALHQLSGLLLVSVIWLVSLSFGGLSMRASSSDFCLAIISGLTAYALPFFLYLKAIQGMGAAKTSILLALPPIFTIMGSFVVLQERLNWWQWCGVVLALAAVSGIATREKTSLVATAPTA